VAHHLELVPAILDPGRPEPRQARGVLQALGMAFTAIVISQR
jgi:hypothetical protein